MHLLQGPYITEAGTPVADMWDAEFGHLDKKKVRKQIVCSGGNASLLEGALVPLPPACLESYPPSTPPSPSSAYPKPAPIPFVLQHMMDMLTLTTRMNALARVTLGNVNIAATTALQVRGPCAGPKGCSCGRGAAVQRRGKAAGCAARGMGAHCN